MKTNKTIESDLFRAVAWIWSDTNPDTQGRWLNFACFLRRMRERQHRHNGRIS